jgi:hypothetical protein
MNKINNLFLLIVLTATNVFSQEREATISFKEESHNFGAIKAADGPVSHVFEFTNTGSMPLIIKNVETSCGCTTPEWTKQPVLAGAKGIIKVSFNPEGRSGAIDKTITISSNASKSPVYLKITGSIIPKTLTVQDEYRFSTGDIRYKSSQISFGTLWPDQSKSEKVEIVNTGKAPVKILFLNVPSHLSVKAVPEVLQPDQKGVINITYNAKTKNDWDFLIDYVYMSLNGKKDSNYKLTITATIEENFSGMTPEQLANAPKVTFENTNFSFGNIKPGQKADYIFKFKNEGKSTLKIRKITTSCGCTTSESKDKEIKPGASSSIKALFNSEGKYGPQNKAITVITNDPKNSKIMLWMKGTIEDKSKDDKKGKNETTVNP